ncbi:MAG: hypothetical protein NTZ80_01280 [Patescibacteria group bacterium]|nr:hypothetical protein [Patescibacteria group bacterium]
MNKVIKAIAITITTSIILIAGYILTTKVLAAYDPVGYLDTPRCDIIGGWVCDQDRFNTADKYTHVRIYNGTATERGSLVAETIANGPGRNDAASFCNNEGDHGFSIPTPADKKDGTDHYFYAYAIDDSGSEKPLTNSPDKCGCNCASPTPTCTLTANPPKVKPGEKATLTWATHYATAGEIVDVQKVVNIPAGSVDASGTVEITPTESKTYLMGVVGCGGTGNCTVEIVIEKPELSCTLETTPSGSVDKGTNLKFTLNVPSNISSIVKKAKIEPAVAAEQNFPFTTQPTATINNETTYTATIYDADNGSATCVTTVKIKSAAEAPTCELSTTPSGRVNAGTELTFNLSITGGRAQKAEINRDVIAKQNFPFAGPVKAVINRTTTYTATVYNTQNNLTGTCVATVRVGGTPGTNPPTCTLSANPETISAGASSILSWTTEYAQTATIDHGIGSVTPVSAGQVTVSPTATTNYTMSLVGADGTGTCSEQITVTTGGGGGGGGGSGGGGGLPNNGHPPQLASATLPQNGNVDLSINQGVAWSSSSIYYDADTSSEAVAFYPRNNVAWFQIKVSNTGDSPVYNVHINNLNISGSRGAALGKIYRVTGAKYLSDTKDFVIGRISANETAVVTYLQTVKHPAYGQYDNAHSIVKVTKFFTPNTVATKNGLGQYDLTYISAGDGSKISIAKAPTAPKTGISITIAGTFIAIFSAIILQKKFK